MKDPIIIQFVDTIDRFNRDILASSLSCVCVFVYGVCHGRTTVLTLCLVEGMGPLSMTYTCTTLFRLRLQ